MIRITCTHCRQVLTIDDGFAGGVCRCQHCGTIQTVPASAAPAAGKGGPKTSALGAAARTLYRAAEHASHSNRLDGSGEHMLSDSTLEELAEIVSSSGLRSNSRRLRQPIPEAGNGKSTGVIAKAKRSRMPLIIAGAVILVLIAVIVLLVMSRDRGATSSVVPPVVQQQAEAQPNFAGMNLQASDTVVYLLDDGGSASDALPAMEAATYRSIKTLTHQRRFAVIFWQEGSPRYPAQGTVRASAEEEQNCEKAMADEFAKGLTQVDDAFKAAMALQPDAVVVVTAKAGQLPDGFADTLLALRGDSHVRIYTVGINGDSTGDANTPGSLATAAARTSGTFLNISSTDLARQGHN